LITNHFTRSIVVAALFLSFYQIGYAQDETTPLYNYIPADELSETEKDQLAKDYMPSLMFSAGPYVDLRDDNYSYPDYLPISINALNKDPDNQVFLVNRNTNEARSLQSWGGDVLGNLSAFNGNWYLKFGLDYQDQDQIYKRIFSVENKSTVYYRVFNDPSRRLPYAIQYWFFYLFNDWSTDHEGDWESVTIFLDQDKSPQEIVLSTHYEAYRYPYDQISKLANTYRPIIYVSNGGHGSWAFPGETDYLDLFQSDNVFVSSLCAANPGFCVAGNLISEGEFKDIRISGEPFRLDSYELVDLEPLEGNSASWLNFDGEFGSNREDAPLASLYFSAPKSPLFRTDAGSSNADDYDRQINGALDPYKNCLPRSGQGTAIYGSTQPDPEGQDYGPWHWASGYGLMTELATPDKGENPCEAVPNSVLSSSISSPSIDSTGNFNFSFITNDIPEAQDYILVQFSESEFPETSKYSHWYHAQFWCDQDVCSIAGYLDDASDITHVHIVHANSGGNSERITKEIQFLSNDSGGDNTPVTPSAVAPIAKISASPNTPTILTRVSLDAADSILANGADYEGGYIWNLSSPIGSQTELTSNDARKVYFTPDIPGAYSISLTISAAGIDGIARKQIVVGATYPEIEVDIEDDGNKHVYISNLSVGSCTFSHVGTFVVPAGEKWKSIKIAGSQAGIVLVASWGKPPAPRYSNWGSMCRRGLNIDNDFRGFEFNFRKSTEIITYKAGDRLPGEKLHIYAYSPDDEEGGGVSNYSVNSIVRVSYDLDNDGVPDNEEDSACLNDSSDSYDSDGDGVCDNADGLGNDPAASVDSDGDGYPDQWNAGKSSSDSTTGLSLDIFPDAASEWQDTDGDGIGDNADAFPTDRSASVDRDFDGSPDIWNAEQSQSDSTTGLVLDAEVAAGYVSKSAIYSFNGSLRDSSGHANNAISSGEIGYTDGFLGEAVQLDGIDDVLTIPDPIISDSGSFSLFVKPDTLDTSSQGNGNSLIISNFLPRSPDGGNLYLQQRNNSLTYGIGKIGQSGPVYTFSNIEEWVHVIATWGDGDYSIYVNGELKDSSQYEGYPIQNVLTLGGFYTGSTDYFQGAIDELNFYDVIITPEEAASIYTKYSQSTDNQIEDPSQSGTVPAIVEGISVTGVGLEVDSLEVRWGSVQNTITYEIYRCTDSESIDSCNKQEQKYSDPISQSDESSYDLYLDALVEYGITYFYRIKSCNSAGCSEFSGAAMGHIGEDLLGAPVENVLIFSATSVNSTVVATWNKVPGFNSYTLYYAPYPDADPIYTLDLGDIDSISADLPEGAAYYLAIQPRSDGAPGPLSNVEIISVEASAGQGEINVFVDGISYEVPTLNPEVKGFKDDGGNLIEPDAQTAGLLISSIAIFEDIKNQSYLDYLAVLDSHRQSAASQVASTHFGLRDEPEMSLLKTVVSSNVLCTLDNDSSCLGNVSSNISSAIGYTLENHTGDIELVKYHALLSLLDETRAMIRDFEGNKSKLSSLVDDGEVIEFGELYGTVHLGQIISQLAPFVSEALAASVKKANAPISLISEFESALDDFGFILTQESIKQTQSRLDSATSSSQIAAAFKDLAQIVYQLHESAGVPYQKIYARELSGSDENISSLLSVTQPSSLSILEASSSSIRTYWTTNSADEVKADLYKDGVLVGEWFGWTVNDGDAVRGEILDEWGCGAGYQLKLSDSDGNNVFSDIFSIDGCDAAIETDVVSQAPIEITNPDSGSELQTGAENIQYDWSGLVGEQIRFDLYKGGSLIDEWSDWASNVVGQSTLPQVKDSWGCGDDYQLYAEATNGQTGWGDYFSIFGCGLDKNTIEILTPNGSAEIPSGKITYVFTWAGASGNEIRVDLFRGEEFVAQWHDWTSNDGEAERGLISSDWSCGGDFRLYMEDTTGRAGWSDYFSIVDCDPLVNAPEVSVVGGDRQISDTDGTAGELVAFTATAIDMDGSIISTEWLLNGSVEGSGLSASLSLPDGETAVTFRATDNDGATRTATVNVTVSAATSTQNGGLEAHWRFNGNFVDATGNGYSLSNHGLGFTADRSGNSQSATSSGITTYASYTASSVIDGIQTVSYWLKRSNPFSGVFIAAGNGNNIDRWEQYADTSSGEIRNLYNKNSSSQWSFFNFGTNDTEWHHIVVVFGSGGAKFYYDGDLAATKSTTEIPDAGFRNFYINSQSNDVGGNGAEAQMDDVRLYSRQLTEDEVSQLYESELPEIIEPSQNGELEVSIVGGDLTVPDSDGELGELVSFTGAASYSDGSIVTTEWLVGGVVVANGLSANLALADGATEVTFRAIDDEGESASDSITVTVEEYSGGGAESFSYSQNFSSDPGFTSLHSSTVHWDSSNREYVVQAFRNNTNQYWAYSPRFGTLNSHNSGSINFDIKFSNLGQTAYPSIRFYSNQPTDISASGNHLTVGQYIGGGISNAIIIYSSDLDVRTISATNSIQNNTWYKVDIDFDGTGKMDFVIKNKATNATIISKSNIQIDEFTVGYMGMGYYTSGSSGTNSTIRLDNIQISGSN
jgi:hypothetical protein